MTVSPQEYNSVISRLINPNEFINMFRIPEDEPIYEIDLNTRRINAPQFLSVITDHNAEIVWFKVDRFFGNIDLYSSTCWIQYINADKEQYTYAAPLIVASLEYGNDQLLIPWVISREVSKSEGEIQFSIQFFKLSEDKNRFLHILNTEPAKSKVLQGLLVNPMSLLEPEQTNPESIEKLEDLSTDMHRLVAAYETLAGQYTLYWTDID